MRRGTGGKDMAISYINTTEVENISQEILSLTNELNTEINNLFLRLSEVPDITKEWVGQQATFYFKKVSSDKKQYIEFLDKLRDIGYKLSTDVSEIQTCINNNNYNESQKGV